MNNDKYASEEFVNTFNESLGTAILAYAAVTRAGPTILRVLDPIRKVKKIATIGLHGAKKSIIIVRRSINYAKHKNELRKLRNLEHDLARGKKV